MDSSRLQPLVFKTFVKGITDNFVDPPEGYARKLDNLLLTVDGKPYQRAGGSCASLPQLPNADRPNAWGKFYATFATSQSTWWWVVWAQRSCYAIAAAGDVDNPSFATWTGTEVLDTASNKFLPSTGDANTRVAFGYRSSHVYVAYYNTSATYSVTDSQTPFKIYFNSTHTTPQVFSCGLPAPGTRWRNAQQFSPQADLGTNHVYTYWAVYKKTYTLQDGSTYVMYGPYVQGVGPTYKTNPIGTGAGTSSTQFWWGDFGGAAAFGNPIYVDSASTFHDDSANWTLEYYRSTDGGTTPYWLMSVSATAGVTTTDTITDATLVANSATHSIGYWASGEQQHTAPERTLSANSLSGFAAGRFMMICNDCGYWDDGYQTVYQSIPGIPDAVPGSFGIAFPERVTGMAAIDVYPIIGCERSIWRIDGQLDSTGGGTITKYGVSSAVGVISHASMVVVGRQLFFAGTDGFYVTNGWTEPQKISSHLDRTYRQITATFQMRLCIFGTFHSAENRIYWSCRSSSSAIDNDMILVLDLNQGISANMTFTTWSGGNIAGNFYPTSFFVSGRSLVTGDRRGFFRVHQEGNLNDDVIDTGVTYASWSKIGVGTELQTPVSSMGNAGITKWVSKFFVACQHRAFGTNTSLSLLCSTEREKSGNWKDCGVVWKTGLSATADQMVRFSRRVGPSGFRSTYWGLRIRKSKTVLFNSDNLGTAHQVTATTLVLDGGNWPAGVYGVASVRLADDNYVTDYPITGQSGNTLTCSGGGLPAGTGKKWEIFGYAINEFFGLDQISVPFVMFSDSNVLGHQFSEDNVN